MAGRRTDVLHRGVKLSVSDLCAHQSYIAATPVTTVGFVHCSRKKTVLFRVSNGRKIGK
jgi:hypothetical protein